MLRGENWDPVGGVEIIPMQCTNGGEEVVTWACGTVCVEGKIHTMCSLVTCALPGAASTVSGP